jgi:hygromycin-B 4-O-kinase
MPNLIDLRAMVDLEQVQQLLNQHFSAPITDLASVEGGQISRVFSFRVGDQEYIVRFNKDNMLTSNLPKEAYLHQKLAPLSIPVPPIVHVGRLGNLHFAISPKVPGQRLETLSGQEVKVLLPQFIEILDAIHHVDVSHTKGYGVFDYQGVGQDASWRGFLSKVDEEEDERDYFGKWHHLFDDTFLERKLFEDIYQHMQCLLDYCPTERYLVYGSASLSNVLAQDGKITAVLDWVDARYGDFVYDIACLDFWYSWLHVPEAFQQYYQKRQTEIPFYQERLLCYQCYLALGAIRFYAVRGDENSYQWTCRNILQRLNAPSRDDL